MFRLEGYEACIKAYHIISLKVGLGIPKASGSMHHDVDRHVQQVWREEGDIGVGT